MMNNIENLKLGDDYHLFISAQKESEALKERFFELYLLYTLSKNLNISLQLDSQFDKAINFLKGSLKIEDFCLMLLDEDSNELKIWKANDVTFEATKDVKFEAGEGISGIVVQTGETVLIQDVSKDERFLYYKGRIPDIGSFLSVPLKLSNGKIIGVLNIHKRETKAFRESDKILFSAVAENIAHAIERARLYEKAERDSIFDGLTTLHTRKYLLENSQREYSKAKRYGEPFSIIMIDIDYFKYFNDTYGHIMGDEILKRTASILKSNVRLGDIVGRFGGEEFIILLPGTDKDGATLTAEKLRAVVERELVVDIDVNTERITITAGVASYPEDGKTVEDIIAMADRFLYLGKESGRNRVVNVVLNAVKVDDKRLNNRYKTALKIARGSNQIQSIEIKVDGKDWKVCTIKNISKLGFKGEVEFEVKLGDVYAGRAVLDPDDYISADSFSMRVTNLKKIHHNKYQVGAEIVDGHDGWKRLFTLIAH